MARLNWLEKWAASPDQAKRVFMRHHPQPAGGLMVKWIQEHVKLDGGSDYTPGCRFTGQSDR